ncbi:uclacyanin 1 [Jatropha curcas]|nr:uclacyanin 1 [Jatropha curcas]
MARRLNMAFLALISIAALIHSSAAQTTHVVGGSLGWVIPPGGASAYSSWAANQTFAVGDILVFNFLNNQHDVVKVTKADYDACSTSNPISSVSTSPARITINETGGHYFFCNFNGHCSAGQKLMINVSAATTTAPTPQPSSSPAPQPSSTSTPVSAPSPSPVSRQTSSPSPSPSPVSTQTSSPSPSPSPVSTPPSPSPVSNPSPAPSSVETFTVGDTQGWAVVANAATFYQSWASNKTFNAGDVLVFNYPNGAHDVAEVTKENYDSCNTANPISLSSTPPTRITLTAGEHFYICTVPSHCTAGQKLAVNVSASSTAPPSPGTSTTSPSPSGSTAPPPPNSSARSLSVAGLSATFFSIIVAFLY